MQNKQLIVVIANKWKNKSINGHMVYTPHMYSFKTVSKA